jgi:hypothetical protein
MVILVLLDNQDQLVPKVVQAQRAYPVLMVTKARQELRVLVDYRVQTVLMALQGPQV